MFTPQLYSSPSFPLYLPVELVHLFLSMTTPLVIYHTFQSLAFSTFVTSSFRLPVSLILLRASLHLLD